MSAMGVLGRGAGVRVNEGGGANVAYFVEANNASMRSFSGIDGEQLYVRQGAGN